MAATAKSISFTLNGAQTTLDVDPNLPLLYALREQLGLKATRFGCGQATCGACTVVVDGKPVMSCDVPVGAVDGGVVETAELLDTEPPHPVLAALLRHQAGQCGYCLSGIAMRAKVLLDNGDQMDRATIARALDDNLCRCGSHGRVLDALEELLNSAGQPA